MPAGQHSICATVNGKPGRRVVNVDREACERLQADLAEHLRASAAGEKARPMLMFDHTAGNAAAKPLGFEWDDKRGILLRVEWTKAGREAVEGGNYGYISPAFRLARGTGEIMGLAGGVEVGSLVNDPAFERNECIAAARADEPEEVQVDYVETANPYGCNQYGEGWRMPHRGMRSKTKSQEKSESERLEKVRADAEKLLEEHKEVSALWSGNELGRKAAQMNKLHLIREIWNSMNSAADAIKKRLGGKGLTESDEKYFRDYMSDLEKQMKRAQKWARTINSKTQTEELRAAFAELEQEQQEEYVDARNVWGCNQYGHREGHEGGSEGKKANANSSALFSRQDDMEKLKKAFEDILKKRGKSLLEEVKNNPKAFIFDGREVIEKMRKEQEWHAEDEWLKQNRGTERAYMTKEDHIAWLQHKIEQEKKRAAKYNDKPIISELEEEIKRLREPQKEKEKASEYIKGSASLPPREEVEKMPHAGDNGDVANSGDNNNKTKAMEKQIKELLGLSPDADAAAVIAAIRAMKNSGAEAKAKTEVLEAECDKHKKTMQDYKEKSADAFIKRLRVNGNLAPKDEEKAKAARTLYLTDPEQAETLFCGMKPVAADVLSDKVTANRVTEPRLSAKYEDMSLEDILNETH